jgi:hypothetical protein
VARLFAYEVGHSGLSHKDRIEKDARRLAGITLAPVQGDNWFSPEAAIIAGFLGRGGKR